MLGAPMTTRPPAEEFLPLRPVEFQVLLALVEEERHGYGILLEVARRGGQQLEPGTLYRALRRMVKAGLAAHASAPSGETDDERRRYYRLTELGRRGAAAEAERMAELVRAARTRGLLRRA